MFYVAPKYVANGRQWRFLQLRWHPDKNPDKLEARIPLSLIACLLSQARVEPCSAMSCHVIFHSVFLDEIKLWAFSVAMCRLPTASSSSSKRQSHGFCTTQMLRQLGCRFVVFAYVSFPFHLSCIWYYNILHVIPWLRCRGFCTVSKRGLTCRAAEKDLPSRCLSRAGKCFTSKATGWRSTVCSWDLSKLLLACLFSQPFFYISLVYVARLERFGSDIGKVFADSGSVNVLSPMFRCNICVA